jgi:Outer membrane cobalamin receptor protein
LPNSSFAADRTNKAAYAELQATSLGGVSYVVAGRRDDNSDFNPFDTYRVGASSLITSSLRLRTSVSTAFNAPAFDQIRPTLFTTGSPNLKPERSRAYEIGLDQSLVYGILHLTADYFNQRFTDLIQFVSGGPPNFLGSYANLTEAESKGYDIGLAMTPVANWSGSVSYTQSTPRVTRVSQDYTGDLKPGDALIRRPTHSGNAILTYSSFNSGSLSVMASYIGKRPDLDFNQFPSPTVTLPAYVKVDLALARDVLHSANGKSSLAFTARVDNALDRRYEDVLHFTTPRRTFLIGARLTGSL